MFGSISLILIGEVSYTKYVPCDVMEFFKCSLQSSTFDWHMAHMFKMHQIVSLEYNLFIYLFNSFLIFIVILEVHRPACVSMCVCPQESNEAYVPIPYWDLKQMTHKNTHRALSCRQRLTLKWNH